MVLSCSRRFSMVLSGSLVLIDSQWFCGSSRRFSKVFNGSCRFLMVLSGSRRFS